MLTRMSDVKKFDIAIIGGGPGGYVAAIRAAQLGFKVGVIEANHMGGICLNWGCIPTKALLRSSEINHLLHNLEQFGFSADNIKFDFKKVVQRSRDVSSQLTAGIGHLMKKNKIEVIDGYGKINGKGKILVENDGKKIADVEAKHIVIATGARARTFPNLQPDGKVIWTYREAMLPDKMPKKLLVIGSGAIGSEFASFYANMGAEVNLVEVQDRVLPVEDTEISQLAEKAFKAQGIKVRTKTNVEQLTPKKTEVEATINGKTETYDRAIVAVGVVGNTDNLNLEITDVKVEKNTILIDEYCRTDEENIYAIGDVAGAPWLAHKASHEGVVCIENIAYEEGKLAKKPHPIKKENIPGCTYCRPQVASVGLTEEKAKAEGLNINVGRFPYVANGKAIAMGEEETGLVKTIFNADNGELIGVHMIGAEVTEMISSYLVGKQMEATEEDFIHTIYAHPTLSEMMHESVLDSIGGALHY